MLTTMRHQLLILRLILPVYGWLWVGGGDDIHCKAVHTRVTNEVASRLRSKAVDQGLQESLILNVGYRAHRPICMK